MNTFETHNTPVPHHDIGQGQGQGQDDDELSLLDLLYPLVLHWRLLLIVPLLAGSAALGLAYLIPPTFTAQTVIMPPQQQQSAAASMLQSLGALGGLAGAASGLKSPNDQYLALLKTRGLRDVLIDRFDLMTRYNAKLRDDARKGLEKSVRISSGKDGLIQIEADDSNPKAAAELANAHVEELTKLLGRLAVTEAQQRRLFFETKLKEAQSGLAKAELDLQASGIQAGVLKNLPQAAVEGLAKLEAAITAQEVKLASMRGYLTDAAPEFKRAQSELSALKSQLTKAERPVTEQEGGERSQYTSLYRQFKYQETLFELFSKQYEIARIDESRDGPLIQVVDKAEPPERKSKPQKGMIAVLATLGSGFALLLFVLARHAWRNALTTPETAEKMRRLKQALKG